MTLGDGPGAGRLGRGERMGWVGPTRAGAGAGTRGEAERGRRRAAGRERNSATVAA